MKTAIVAGTTGLIGSQLTGLLLNDDYYDKVIVLSRKPLEIKNSKFVNLVVHYDNLAEHVDLLRGDDVFCCLGTTIKIAGSQQAFYKVDHDYPLSLATVTQSRGAKQYLIVTAMGSDKNSSIFYNRVKGEVEEDLKKVGFETLHILQPSMLIGPRTEKRRGEAIGQSVMKVLGFLIPDKYKAIESLKVAKAMIAIARSGQKGTHVHDSAELQNY